MEKQKICNKCDIGKDISEFYFRKESNTYKNYCKTCVSTTGKIYRNDNKVLISEKRKNNYLENKDIILNDMKNYYKNNSDKIKTKRKEYYENNKKIINKKENERKKIKYKTDRFFALKENLRTNIRKLFKINKINKNNNTIKIIGCSFKEFKLHIESKFEPWMSWDNYGNPKDGVLELNKTWDIDHIIPISTAITEDDIIRLNHYSNLQPLCSYTNRFIKKDRI